MAAISSSLLAVAADRLRAQEVADAIGLAGGECCFTVWHPDCVAVPSVHRLAVFVCSRAHFAAGLDAIGRLVNESLGCNVVVAGFDLSADEQAALLAAGAADFVSMPGCSSELRARLCRAAGMLPPPVLNARRVLDPRLGAIVGASPAFARSLAQLPTIAGCDASVLIHGETGTGKEVCAQAIHYISARASQAWVAVNCGAIASDLIESELFGHVRGAFTSAHVARTGLVREAEGGTLFLDDIDCLPLDAQAKLLRFLQEREYRQVGANAVQRANVRVIAASNQPLRELTSQGRFRQDLYYRLNVLNLKLPALRERRADVAPLALHFLHQFAREFTRPANALDPAAVHKLLMHSWPGNVRELKHVIERAVLLSHGTVLRADDVEIDDAAAAPVPSDSLRSAKARVVEDFERAYIERLLVLTQGNISSAASAAKKNRRAFWELIRKYEIDPGQFRAPS
jgi:two-component system, NtrC family, response regulator GlrR